MHIFRHIFLSNYWWQRSDIWSQASYRYPISWEGFLDPSDSYFLFADFVDFYTHWTYILYMPIFSRIFLSNYWWQKSDIWSQASYRYPISWEAFLDPSDSYFLFAEERGYHKWALAHSSSCLILVLYFCVGQPNLSNACTFSDSQRVLYVVWKKNVMFSFSKKIWINVLTMYFPISKMLICHESTVHTKHDSLIDMVQRNLQFA
jgi:hypothetical protein